LVAENVTKFADQHDKARFLGAEQGDSTGDDGTSSDSDGEGGCGESGLVAKILQTRARFQYLTSLKQLCLSIIIKSTSKLESSQQQKIIFQNIGI
jgi:hypothetical protein